MRFVWLVDAPDFGLPRQPCFGSAWTREQQWAGHRGARRSLRGSGRLAASPCGEPWASDRSTHTSRGWNPWSAAEGFSVSDRRLPRSSDRRGGCGCRLDISRERRRRRSKAGARALEKARRRSSTELRMLRRTRRCRRGSSEGQAVSDQRHGGEPRLKAPRAGGADGRSVIRSRPLSEARACGAASARSNGASLAREACSFPSAAEGISSRVVPGSKL